MTSLHRTNCGKCGYPSLAKRGKTLCCSAPLYYESKVKVKTYKRKRRGPLGVEKEGIKILSQSSVSRQPVEGPDPDKQLKLFGG